jgi:hypothetical protein
MSSPIPEMSLSPSQSERANVNGDKANNSSATADPARHTITQAVLGLDEQDIPPFDYESSVVQPFNEELQKDSVFSQGKSNIERARAIDNYKCAYIQLARLSSRLCSQSSKRDCFTC